MKKLIKSIFRSLGFEIRKAGGFTPAPVKSTPDPGTMHSGLERMKRLGIKPAVIFDLGAAQGSWSLKAVRTFENSEYILLEPLEERKEELDQLAASRKNFRIVHAAAGNRVGKTSFVVSDDLDGSGVYDSNDKDGSRTVELTTLDQVVNDFSLRGPFLLKFDTHGFELPILEGAKTTLANTELIVMECYGFHIAQQSLLLHEMSAHMESLGFRIADIVDIMRRPGDDLFWQCDAFFLKKDHPSFKRNTYAI